MHVYLAMKKKKNKIDMTKFSSPMNKHLTIWVFIAKLMKLWVNSY